MNPLAIRFYEEQTDKIEKTTRFFYRLILLQLVFGVLGTALVIAGFYMVSLYFWAAWLVFWKVSDEVVNNIKRLEREMIENIQQMNRAYRELMGNRV